jgi:hypothetical protein
MTSISGQPPVGSSSAYPAASPSVSNVAATSNVGLSVTAVSLASDAGVIATLGATSPPSYTYDAKGLLNSLVQAGTAATVPPQESGATSAAAAQSSLDQAVLGSLAGAATNPSLYSVSGGLQAPTVDVSASFASILKADPGAAGTVIGDSLNQGIIGSISTSA